MDQPQIQTVWRFNYGERKFEAKFEDIFDVVTEVPDEWLEQVQVSKPPAIKGYPTTGTYFPSGKGKAEHLKPYQFKKTSPEAEGLVNGNRVGPHLRDGFGGFYSDPLSDDYDDVYEGRLPIDGSLWGQPWDLLGGHGDERFARITEDPSTPSANSRDINIGGAGLGKTNGELAKNNLRNETLEVEAGSPGFDDNDGALSLMAGHDRYDEIAINHGASVADSYCLIDDCMGPLSGKDELLEELIFDMFELSSDEGQAKLFRQLYDRLPTSVQEKLAMNGF